MLTADFYKTAGILRPGDYFHNPEHTWEPGGDHIASAESDIRYEDSMAESEHETHEEEHEENVAAPTGNMFEDQWHAGHGGLGSGQNAVAFEGDQPGDHVANVMTKKAGFLNKMKRHMPSRRLRASGWDVNQIAV